MSNPCLLYQLQLNKAKETLATLLQQRQLIEAKLLLNPISPELHKDLRTINLEIKITNNEIELAESNLKACEIKNNTSL